MSGRHTSSFGYPRRWSRRRGGRVSGGHPGPAGLAAWVVARSGRHDRSGAGAVGALARSRTGGGAVEQEPRSAVAARRRSRCSRPAPGSPRLRDALGLSAASGVDGGRLAAAADCVHERREHAARQGQGRARREIASRSGAARDGGVCCSSSYARCCCRSSGGTLGVLLASLGARALARDVADGSAHRKAGGNPGSPGHERPVVQRRHHHSHERCCSRLTPAWGVFRAGRVIGSAPRRASTGETRSRRLFGKSPRRGAGRAGDRSSQRGWPVHGRRSGTAKPGSGIRTAIGARW